jgi:hypothetical protein
MSIDRYTVANTRTVLYRLVLAYIGHRVMLLFYAPGRGSSSSMWGSRRGHHLTTPWAPGVGGRCGEMVEALEEQKVASTM